MLVNPNKCALNTIRIKEYIMRDSININAKSCCSQEKDRLMDVLRTCDYCTESMEERHYCYQQAAKQSGKRSRECIMSV